MDINRVELKGRIANDISYRKTKNGNEWATFSVVTNEYNSKAEIDKDKSIPTWTDVAVFNPTIVEKLKSKKARSGNCVWLVGKLYSSKKEKNGYKFTYTNVIVSEFELVKTKNDNNTEMPSIPQQNDNEFDF